MMVVAFWISDHKSEHYGIVLSDSFELELSHAGTVQIKAFPDEENAKAWLQQTFHVEPKNVTEGGLTGAQLM